MNVPLHVRRRRCFPCVKTHCDGQRWFQCTGERRSSTFHRRSAAAAAVLGRIVVHSASIEQVRCRATTCVSWYQVNGMRSARLHRASRSSLSIPFVICISMTHPSHAKGCVLWHPLREQCPFAQLWCSGVICMHGLRDYAFHDACAVRPRRRPGVCRRRAVARGPRPLPSQHSPGAAPVSLPQHRQVRGHCFRWHL